MNKNINIFIWGRFISILGSMIQWVALPLYILDKTGSPSAMGILFAVTAVPKLLISPFAGAIADKWNRKNVMVITDFINGFLTLVLYGYLVNFEFNLLYLIIIRVMIDTVSTVFHTSTQALLPELCSKENLTKVNSINSSLQAFANIMGPIVGGVLYAYFGIGIVILINVLSFLITGLLEMFIKYDVVNKGEDEKNINFKSIKEDMISAYEYLKKDKAFFSVLIFIALVTFMTQGIGVVVMPYLMRNLLDMSPQNYGFMQVMPVIGMMAGSLYLQKKNNKESKKIAYISFALNGIISTVFGIVVFPQLLLIYKNSFILKNFVFGLIFLILGVINAMTMIGYSVMYQERISKEFFGRVTALEFMITQGLSPIGLLIASFLVEKTSVFVYVNIAMVFAWLIYFGTKNKFKKAFIEEGVTVEGGVEV